MLVTIKTVLNSKIDFPTLEELQPSGHNNFFKVWLASSFSNLGDGLYQLALPLVMVSLTRDPTLVAGLNVVLSLPWLVFSLFAGRIVDRSDRRVLMLWTNAFRALLLLLLTLALLSDWMSIPLLFGIAFLLGIGETLVDTALTTIVPAVTSKAELTQANARIETAINLSNQFVAPPLGGLLATLGLWLNGIVSGALYVISFISLLTMKGHFKPQATNDANQASLWLVFTKGLRTLFAQPLLRDLTLFTAAMNLCWAMWGAVLVLYVVQPGEVGLGSFEYSLLMTAMALGGTLGAALCNTLERKLGQRFVLLIDVVGTAALVGIPALTSNPWVIALGMFLGGFGSSVWRVIVATLRQQLTPDDLLGQVYTASRFLSWGVTPLGALLAGFIAATFGVRAVFGVAGVVAVILVGLFLWSFGDKRFEHSRWE